MSKKEKCNCTPLMEHDGKKLIPLHSNYCATKVTIRPVGEKTTEQILGELYEAVEGLKDEYPYSIWKPLPHDWTEKLDKWCQTQGWRIDRVSAEYARINHKRIKNHTLSLIRSKRDELLGI